MSFIKQKTLNETKYGILMKTKFLFMNEMQFNLDVISFHLS